jgi:hypothetical protein
VSQTSIIAGSLIIAYIVFVTVRGELPAYLSVLGVGGGAAVTTPSGCAAGQGQGQSNVQKVVDTATNLVGSGGSLSSGSPQ